MSNGYFVNTKQGMFDQSDKIFEAMFARFDQRSEKTWLSEEDNKQVS